jgi:hypothetical protein
MISARSTYDGGHSSHRHTRLIVPPRWEAASGMGEPGAPCAAADEALLQVRRDCGLLG